MTRRAVSPFGRLQDPEMHIPPWYWFSRVFAALLAGSAAPLPAVPVVIWNLGEEISSEPPYPGPRTIPGWQEAEAAAVGLNARPRAWAGRGWYGHFLGDDVRPPAFQRLLTRQPVSENGAEPSQRSGGHLLNCITQVPEYRPAPPAFRTQSSAPCCPSTGRPHHALFLG